MINDIIKNKLDYLLLFIFCIIYVGVFLFNQLRPTFLIQATLSFGVVYFLWGIFHHSRNHSLTGKIVLEYLLVSIFAILLVSTLLI